MTEELEQLLKNLKLRRMLKVYDEQLQAAEKAQIPYTEFVAGLLRAQWHERQESALEWRIHRANLPERWSLETFPWSRQPVQQLTRGTVRQRCIHFIEQILRPNELTAVSVLQSFQQKAAGQPRFAHAGGAHQHQVLVLRHEVEVGERAHLLAVHARLARPGKRFQ